MMLLTALMDFDACDCGCVGTHGSGGEACTRTTRSIEQSTRKAARCGEWTACEDNKKTEGVVQVVHWTVCNHGARRRL